MAASLFNFNVGVLGHVDSGKTTLSKALSTVASTASFDKNPQSKERGITLDLGFSSFTVDLPDHLSHEKYDRLQFTLVDCPGHASLIRTIIGGAQIIDLMLLVVDVTKGVQTQTAECLVIGEVTCEKMIIVLNKTDLLPENKRAAMIEKMSKRLQKTLEGTRLANSPIIAVAANPGASEDSCNNAIGVDALINALKAHTYKPQRNKDGPFIFSVDHCFSIRGQGTVMTGTVLSGSTDVNDTVEIPALKVTKKIKSMQMFKQPVTSAMQGDRVGVCVTQFDPKQLERGLVCSVGALPTIEAALVSVHRIKYFKQSISTKAKFHVTMGHETVMAKVTFFKSELSLESSDETSLSGLHLKENVSFDFSQEYSYMDKLPGSDDKDMATESSPTVDVPVGSTSKPSSNIPLRQYALLELEKPVTCPHSCLVIGSKLDTDIHANLCRIAFHGRLLEAIDDTKFRNTVLPRLKVFKCKSREGLVDRVSDDYSVIGKNLFKKESNIQSFVGLKVTLSSGEQGVIEGGFGQSGKFKVRISAGVSQLTKDRYADSGKKKNKGKGDDDSANQNDSLTSQQPIRIFLHFKRYLYDPEKRMMQT